MKTPEADDDAVERALDAGLEFFVSRQNPDGSWSGDYSGPLFLLPMYVAASHICRRPIPRPLREGIVRHFLDLLLPAGGLGFHADSRRPSMFTTVLGYVALRLLGLGPQHERLAPMRRWIHAHGTALATASWGKFVLALLNLYDFRGLNPVLPELYLLPRRFALHPGRLWCHARQVYLPMSFLYGSRSQIEESPLLLALRDELYDRPYDEIPFHRFRHQVYEGDLHRPVSRLARLGFGALRLFDRLPLTALRQRALRTVLAHIEYEDRTTDHLRLGPVNAVLNTVVHFFADPSGESFERGWSASSAYLWRQGEVVKMNGQNSTALWDTAFSGLMLLATPGAETWRSAIDAAHDHVRESQILEDPPECRRFFRHPPAGGWPFPNRAHGWPVSDCTAEALKFALEMEFRVERPVAEGHLLAAVRFLLSLQNRDGGWGTYEPQRGGRWWEKFNPSEVFGDIMVDASRVENTSSCLQALALARHRFPHLGRTITAAIQRGERFLRRQQRADGSWEGFWGVCFTYGTWFGVWGLRAAGAAEDDPALHRAAGFLLAHQRADGGWGEDYSSCTRRRYHPHRDAHPVQTAWALMSLLATGRGDAEETHRACRFLLRTQLESGDWPHRFMVGVFNRTSMIRYDNYRRIFCLWALALFADVTKARAEGRASERGGFSVGAGGAHRLDDETAQRPAQQTAEGEAAGE